MFNWHISAVLLSLALPASAQPAFPANAQLASQSGQWTQATVDAARKTIVIILDRLKPVLPPTQKKYAEAARFQVGAYGDYYAYFDPYSGEIHMPFGIWHGFRLISWAYQDANDDPSLLPRVRDYLKFIGLRMQSIQPNTLAVLQPDFRTWAGLPLRPQLSQSEERQRSAREVDYLVQAMAFILAHELVHLKQGDKASADITPAQSREQERLADIGARLMLEKAGFDVLPAAQAMMILGLTKISPNGELIQVPSHPHPFCRVYTTFTVPINRQRDSPEFVDAIRKMGMPSVDYYIRELLSLKEAC
jgi:hypothetical protein